MLAVLLSLVQFVYRSTAETSLQRDVSALVQGSWHLHFNSGSHHTHSDDAEEESGEEVPPGNISKFVHEVPGAPVAITKLGAIRGLDLRTYTLFGGVPYAQKPGRFEVAKPKKPWAPKTLNATQFGLACIGARTEMPEGEDCLHLNIWVPKGEQTNMPVIVYFHGGMNQHGSGSEPYRRGDGIAMNKEFPTIFINFDFRLGIYGWIDLEGSDVPANLGVHDQQSALRWVKDNIAAFGGDPKRVTLEGQSEGCGTILVHMTAPGSSGLFNRVVLHSPVADMWSRKTNRDRTDFMVKRAFCNSKNTSKVTRCLKKMNADKLWSLDWVSEELSRGVGKYMWMRNFWGMTTFAMRAKDKAEVVGEMGWHPVIDGETVLGEPRDLIRQGRFAKVPVLITVSKNETYGVIPNGDPEIAEKGLRRLLKSTDYDKARLDYAATLLESGITTTSEADLLNQMLTDKLFTCDARWLARDITEGGGRGHLGMWWHEPKYDPMGSLTSPICSLGASCHASEMFYVLPQAERGIQGLGMQGELKFSNKYSNAFLAFVHGADSQHPWQAWNETQPMTFFDAEGTRVVPGYRKEQCSVLDKSMGEYLPSFMQDITGRTL